MIDSSFGEDIPRWGALSGWAGSADSEGLRHHRESLQIALLDFVENT